MGYREGEADWFSRVEGRTVGIREAFQSRNFLEIGGACREGCQSNARF